MLVSGGHIIIMTPFIAVLISPPVRFDNYIIKLVFTASSGDAFAGATFKTPVVSNLYIAHRF